MENKKIIFYLNNNNYNNQLDNHLDCIYNTEATHIHFGYFHFFLYSLCLNYKIPNDDYYNEMWFELGIADEKNKKCVMVLDVSFMEADYNDYYNELSNFIKENKLIKGIDLDVENKISLETFKKLINDLSRDFPYLILSISTIGYSMCVRDIDTIYEDENVWSYILFNKSIEANKIEYYNCNFNEDDFTMDSFEDMIDNGFQPEKLIMGCNSKFFFTYDNYYELRNISKKYNIGGTFIKYFNNSPYKWAMSVLLCITSK